MNKPGKSRSLVLTGIVSLMVAMHEQVCWPADCPPILRRKIEPETMLPTDLLAMYSRIWSDLASDKTVVILGKKYTPADLADKMAAYIGAEPHTVEWQIIAGDHRDSAIVLLEALGFPLPYEVPYVDGSDLNVEQIEILSNRRPAQTLSDVDFITLLAREQRAGRLNAPLQLEKGDFGFTKEGKPFAHGRAQYVFNQAKLVDRYAIPAEQAVRVNGANSHKALASPDPVAFVKALLEGAIVPVKASSGKEIVEIGTMAVAKADPVMGSIFEALAIGQAGVAAGKVSQVIQERIDSSAKIATLEAEIVVLHERIATLEQWQEDNRQLEEAVAEKPSKRSKKSK